jgi:hypothetical protein
MISFVSSVYGLYFVTRSWRLIPRLKMEKYQVTNQNLPQAYPILPSALLTHPDLITKIQELVNIASVGQLYQFSE